MSDPALALDSVPWQGLGRSTQAILTQMLPERTCSQGAVHSMAACTFRTRESRAQK
jgi:hypothetical protein